MNQLIQLAREGDSVSLFRMPQDFPSCLPPHRLSYKELCMRVVVVGALIGSQIYLANHQCDFQVSKIELGERGCFSKPFVTSAEIVSLLMIVLAVFLPPFNFIANDCRTSSPVTSA